MSCMSLDLPDLWCHCFCRKKKSHSTREEAIKAMMHNLLMKLVMRWNAVDTHDADSPHQTCTQHLAPPACPQLQSDIAPGILNLSWVSPHWPELISRVLTLAPLTRAATLPNSHQQMAASVRAERRDDQIKVSIRGNLSVMINVVTDMCPLSGFCPVLCSE